MKFRDPVTQKVFSGIVDANDYFCAKSAVECNSCPLDIPSHQQKKISCESWCKTNQEEAARLMGYEVVEDDHYNSSGKCGICEKSIPDGYDGLLTCSVSGEAKRSEDKCNVVQANMDKPHENYVFVYGGGPIEPCTGGLGGNQQAKADQGKPHPSYVPVALIEGVMAVREYGNQKYHDPDNWKQVEPERYHQAMLRHILAAWNDPYKIDPESGLPHIAHVATNIAFLLEMKEEKK